MGRKRHHKDWLLHFISHPPTQTCPCSSSVSLHICHLFLRYFATFSKYFPMCYIIYPLRKLAKQSHDFIFIFLAWNWNQEAVSCWVGDGGLPILTVPMCVHGRNAVPGQQLGEKLRSALVVVMPSFWAADPPEPFHADLPDRSNVQLSPMQQPLRKPQTPMLLEPFHHPGQEGSLQHSAGHPEIRLDEPAVGQVLSAMFTHQKP